MRDIASDWWASIRMAARGHPTILALYTVFALQAFIFQAFLRLHACAGFPACALSLTKGIIWPLYWLSWFLFF
jgi:hypothetical protein